MVGVNSIILLVLLGLLLQFSKKYLQSQVELQNQNWCHEHDSMTGLQISALFSYCFVPKQFLTFILGIEAAGKS